MNNLELIKFNNHQLNISTFIQKYKWIACMAGTQTIFRNCDFENFDKIEIAINRLLVEFPQDFKNWKLPSDVVKAIEAFKNLKDL